MVMMVVVVGTKVAAVEVVKVLVDDIEEVVVVVSSVDFTWVVAIALFDGKGVAGMVTVVVTDDGAGVLGVVVGCTFISVTV